MATYFFGSSALVKYYINEVGSGWVESLINANPPNDIVIAQITGVEVVAAVSRRVRAGMTSAADASTAINAFRNDFQAKYIVAPLTNLLFDAAMNLAELHQLRSYDAMQLAVAVDFEAEMTAVGIGPLTLISADVELNQAAQAEGLLTDDPNQHP
ncbi:MAG: type II toxin-antitoxin system VapC family toxin [Acidobacteria bacterium]|nr:type II toxin-antitoxin system VapC family toxin [Acidobacteriota bacterium]